MGQHRGSQGGWGGAFPPHGHPAHSVPPPNPPSSEAGPDFELKVELYSAGLAGGGAQGSTPRKLATRLSTSLGRSSGKRVRAAMDGGPGSPPGNGGTGPLLLPAPNVP